MLYYFKLYINKGTQRCQLSLSYSFLGWRSVKISYQKLLWHSLFICLLCLIIYYSLSVEAFQVGCRGTCQSILCRPTSSLKRCSTIHFLIWHMRYLGVHSVILHDHYLFIYLCFSNRSYHIRQFSMTAYNSITVVTF